MRKGWSWLSAYCAALYGFLYLPLLVMFVFSFNDARRNVVWKGFTLKWYAVLFSDAELMKAMLTSLELAAAAAGIASVIGLLAAYAMTRHKPFPGRQAYGALLTVPLMMPEVALGVGILSFLVRAGFELDFGALACSHALICLPYTVGSVRARLKSIGDANLEDAAMDLGATEWQAFWKVTLPLLAPAVLSGALLAFTVSFEDFVISFFVTGIGIVTMPIKVYSMMKFGVTPEINALSVCLLAATLGLVALNAWLASRQERA
ncbi:MAG: ABC transporter permease [Elusimicrobiota bacterium]|nr:ABC transporter permease [Elusimicrobiota bacterium]